MKRKRVVDSAGRPVKAIAMLSGGLDSSLAAAVVKRLGIDVLGLHVRHLFSGKPAAERDPIADSAAQIGIPLRVIDRPDEQLEIVRHPHHGTGAGMNPCIDCRIFILRVASGVMEDVGAQFVITGEVLGQRPMSQHLKALELVAKQSALEDRLLRPLSARFLPETLPVREGWIRLEDLPEIHGRGRQPQIELARYYGIRDFPQPAGGCLLIEKAYSARLRDAFSVYGADQVDRQGFELLALGRHFRLSANAKVILGHDEQENAKLAEKAGERAVLDPVELMGPTGLVEGNPSDEELRLAASLLARYSDHRPDESVRVRALSGPQHEQETILEVLPLAADDERIALWRLDDTKR
ncbi:hypothetical protein JW848_00550 [Candidatus Bipolaricaulota bacterium]|nr:hypothetical protein [Candidatus Bipolaricaulota bacterium]